MTSLELAAGRTWCFIHRTLIAIKTRIKTVIINKSVIADDTAAVIIVCLRVTTESLESIKGPVKDVGN